MAHPRPLSPHLQIYRPQLTSILSILHRLSGIALTVGLFMLTWFFGALISGPEAFAVFTSFCASPLGMLMLMGWSFAVCFHMCTGIRHLCFDTGSFFDLSHAYAAGYIAIVSSFILTGMLWFYVFCS